MKLANSGAADSLLRPGRGMVGVAFAPIVPVTVTQSHLNCGLVGRRSPIASQFGHAPVFSSNFKRGFCGIPNKIVESASERCSAELKGLALAMSAASSLRELKGIKAIDGSDIPSSTFDGKVTLAVNVASACGYTNAGYRMLKDIGEEFGSKVVLVAIPCNAFGMQESGSASEIREFVKERYDRIVVTEKIQENPVKHPIFAVAAAKLPGPVTWNFDGKYLFSRNGEPVKRFDNTVTTADIAAAIKELL